MAIVAKCQQAAARTCCGHQFTWAANDAESDRESNKSISISIWFDEISAPNSVVTDDLNRLWRSRAGQIGPRRPPFPGDSFLEIPAWGTAIVLLKVVILRLLLCQPHIS